MHLKKQLLAGDKWSIFVHGANVVLCVFLALIVFSLSALGRPFFDWADAVYYLATAKHLALYSSFIPVLEEYSQLATVLSSTSSGLLVNYPNYGFEILLAAWGGAVNNFSLINGVYLSGVFTVLTAIVIYAFSYGELKNKALAMLIVVGVLLHRVVFEISPRPLSDAGLMFFFMLCVWAMLNNKALLAGIALAAGYFYREHALLFFPFIAWLSPECVSITSYIRITCIAGCGFILGPLAAWICKYIFMQGLPAGNYYADYYTEHFRLSFEHGKRLLLHMRTYAVNLGVVLVVAIGVMLCRVRTLELRVLRLLAVAGALAMVPCVLFVKNPGIPERYLAYSIPLLWLGIALWLKRHKSGTAIFAGVIVFAVLLRFPPAITKNALVSLGSPQHSFSQLKQEVDAPLSMLAELFPNSNTVLLSEGPPFALVALNSPTLVRLPEYSTFLKSSDNTIVEGIIVEASNDQWPDSPSLQDASGVLFQRVALPKYGVQPKIRVYRKVLP